MFSAPVLITGCVVVGIVYWGKKRNTAAWAAAGAEAAEALQPIIDDDGPIIPVDNQCTAAGAEAAEALQQIIDDDGPIIAVDTNENYNLV